MKCKEVRVLLLLYPKSLTNKKQQIEFVMIRGLGKTVQTIAFLAWLKHHSTANRKTKSNDNDVIEIDEEIDSDTSLPSADDDYMKPHIIIVPASVLSNWEREFKKFCPDMTVIR